MADTSAEQVAVVLAHIVVTATGETVPKFSDPIVGPDAAEVLVGLGWTPPGTDGGRDRHRLGRPVVITEPGMRFGRPHVGGSSVDAIAGLVHAGESVEDVADDYGLSRDEVLVACWWTARYGTRKERTRWAGWLAQVEGPLARGDYNNVPDPPDKTEM